MERGQVWVETVIYTMVGLALIGFVMALVIPRVNEYKDKSIVEGTISSLDAMDEKIGQVLSAPGNVRIVDFVLKRGYLTIDAENDLISFELEDSTSVFSEPGTSVKIGRVNVTTIQKGRKYSVFLVLPVSGDLVLKDSTDNTKRLSPVSIPYRLSFENTGVNSEGKQVIAFRESSGA